MSGRKPFRELTKNWSDERHTRVKLRTADLREEMTLRDLRKALGVSQEELAAKIARSQGAIAKLEHRGDAKVSSIMSVIEAMGGKLEIRAKFPEGDVKIMNFEKAAE